MVDFGMAIAPTAHNLMRVRNSRSLQVKKGVVNEPVCNFRQVRGLCLVSAPKSSENVFGRHVFRSAKLEYVSPMFSQRTGPTTGKDCRSEGCRNWKFDKEKTQYSSENSTCFAFANGFLSRPG